MPITSNQYDVLAEAAQAGSGPQGTGFLLDILPFIDNNTLGKNWHYDEGISSSTPFGTYSNYALANADVKEFYCPARRGGVRRGDMPMMLSSAWTGGGTDYGGCAGRHAAFTLQTGYNLCDESMHYRPDFCPTDASGQKVDDAEKAMGHLRPGLPESGLLSPGHEHARSATDSQTRS